MSRDALALQCSLLWLGARCPCVDGLASQRLSLPQETPPNTTVRRPGPVGACSDAELADHIRRHAQAPAACDA